MTRVESPDNKQKSEVYSSNHEGKDIGDTPSDDEDEAMGEGDWKVIEVTLIEICISIRVKWNVIENALLHFDSLPLYLN